MLSAIKKRLSIKVSIILAIVTLPLLALAAVAITAREVKNMEELTIEQGKNAARIAARVYGDLLDAAIDNGYLYLADVFDQNYEEIKGYDWGKNVKFHTRYDWYTDRVVEPFMDRILENDTFLYALGYDINTYAPTHNGKTQRPPIGDPKVDYKENRTKRKFEFPVVLNAVRSLEPVLVQPYQRDTGQWAWDVSAPIFVKGQHWGGFRVGVGMEKVSERKSALLMELLVIFGLLGLTTVGIIFIM